MATFDDAMALIFDELVSIAQRTGLFDAVAGHEPKNAPGSGVACAVWISDMRPIQEGSGLASMGVRVEFTYRIFTSMLQEPQDGIDPAVTRACASLFAALAGNFLMDDTTGLLRGVDLLGYGGEGLRALPGHLTQDGKPFRVMDVFVPIVIDNAFTETA